jgi:hypothetical protein
VKRKLFGGRIPFWQVHGIAIERDPPDISGIAHAQPTVMGATTPDDDLVGRDSGRYVSERTFH